MPRSDFEKRPIRIVTWIAFTVSLCWGCGGDVESQLALKPRGQVSIDIELGSGVSFRKGSLEVTNHDRSDVVVVADVSGWGGYAVDLDATEHKGNVRIVGRVDGALHWLFGGPSVDVRVLVPPGGAIDARIDGGPLLLEDLTNSIRGRAGDSDIAARRIEGKVDLSSRGSIELEDVDGVVSIQSDDGGVEVSGVRGNLDIRTEGSAVAIASVTGSVSVSAGRGEVEIERVHGPVRVASKRGSIALQDIEGDVHVASERGRIDVKELAGAIAATSGRGGIEVEFLGSPAGSIDAQRGSIHVEVPAFAGFDLHADAGRGKIQLDESFAFVAIPDDTDVAASDLGHPLERWHEIGLQIAAEVQSRVHAQMERVGRELEHRRRGGTGDAPGDGDVVPDRDWLPGRDDPSSSWEAPHWGWNNPDWEWGWGGGFDGWKDRPLVSGTVNGGGEALRLSARRGSIQILER